ncbi:MAG: excinuclease ABC subunit UvrC [Gammaproteobacteria bacterium]|nr:excinuclease ABC subunit UvrC [Gammaproteobacteria bacterium]
MLDNPKQFLASLPNKPGIYQMYGDKGQILYVGKAKNLKNRVSSYFRGTKDPKTDILMSQVKNIEIIITPSENSALLLESNLIKTKKPRYNVAFKDDRSFPYLILSKHDFPRLEIYRGVINKSQGKYFGPFPDASAVHFIYDLIQKVFRLRVCKDSFMCNRSRPCMLYQIKLCGAPCVGSITKEKYALQVKLVEQFLLNKSKYVVEKLTKLMDESSARLAYELAANYRDQISDIRRVQAEQAMTNAKGNYDVIVVQAQDGDVVINILFVRNGLVIGNKNYFPKTSDFAESQEEVLSAFILHYYLQDKIDVLVPDKILVNIKLPDRLNIGKILYEKYGCKVVVSDCIKGAQKQLITMAEANGLNALKTHSRPVINYIEYLFNLKEMLCLSIVPNHIECFDVSHTMGEAQIASCVVFKGEGSSKAEYRRFNIKTTNVGDDYGALREALIRRYVNSKDLPDIIMVDGGRGQLNVASKVLRDLMITKPVLLGIAKGEGRKPGLEVIYMLGKKDPMFLPPRSLALHLMQQIRDEAHRFAITGHRKKMIKSRQKSELENISGVGKSKRTDLLKYFGGMVELKSAGIDDLAKVKGVGGELARRIYEHLHA